MIWKAIYGLGYYIYRFFVRIFSLSRSIGRLLLRKRGLEDYRCIYVSNQHAAVDDICKRGKVVSYPTDDTYNSLRETLGQLGYTDTDGKGKFVKVDYIYISVGGKP